MTEISWLTETDPLCMLGCVQERAEAAGRSPYQLERKLRLLACACCRLVPEVLRPPRWKKAVVRAEAYADGALSLQKLQAAHRDAAAMKRYVPLNRMAVWASSKDILPALTDMLGWMRTFWPAQHARSCALHPR